MTEKEEKIEVSVKSPEPVAAKDAATDTGAVDASSVSVAASPSAEKDKSLAKQPAPALHKEASKGEKIYDKAVYSGLNYWVNLGLSLVIADYFVNKGGKAFLTKAAEGLGKSMAKTPGSVEATTRTTERTLETLTLLSGGWALLYPMKKLEDNKRPIVHWLNDKMGIDQSAPDGHKETADEIFIEKEQPKQSWAKVILRRCMATASVLATGQVLNVALRNKEKTDAWVKSADYDKTRDPFGGKAVTEKFIIDNVNKGLKSGYVPSGEKIAENETFKRYLGLAALDSVFTKITAVVMQVTNGAKKGRMPKEIGDDQDPPVIYDGIDEIITAPPAPATTLHPADAVSASVAATAACAPPKPEKPKFLREHIESVESKETKTEKFAEEKVEKAPREAESYKKESVLQRSIRPNQVKEQSDTGLALAP